MIDKGLFTITPHGFEPHDERAHTLHQRLLAQDVTRHEGKPVFMSVRTARNPEFSALAHVVFSKLADGLGVPMDAIKNYLKEQTGRFDLVKMPDGSFIKLRKSVRFSAMSEEQFRAFWDEALPIIFERLLGKVKSVEYRDIVDILDGKRSPRS
jgi:hypothetical protein